jgi:hypothetical protein
MPYFIPEPLIDENPVTAFTYWKWRLGKWMERAGRQLMYEAEDRCDMCGTIRHGHDHSKCDGIPF